MFTFAGICKGAVFLQLVGVQFSDQLTKSAIRKYKKELKRIPRNRNKNPTYRGIPLQELVSKEIPDSERLSKTTISNHFIKVSAFLRWLAVEGYAITDLDRPLLKTVRAIKKMSINASENTLPFETEQLRAIFENEKYVKGLWRRPSEYWLPLMALFSGCRIEELCQLRPSDFSNEHGFLQFKIEGSLRFHQKIKTHFAKRIVPVHAKLIQLGIVDYLQEIRLSSKDPQARIFPDLKKGSKDNWSGKASDRFGNFKNQLEGFEKRKHVFHSFRSLVATQLMNRHSFPHQHVSDILGHAPAKGATQEDYVAPLELEQRNEIIQNLKYEIEWSKIRPWQYYKKTKKWRKFFDIDQSNKPVPDQIKHKG